MGAPASGHNDRRHGIAGDGLVAPILPPIPFKRRHDFTTPARRPPAPYHRPAPDLLAGAELADGLCTALCAALDVRDDDGASGRRTHPRRERFPPAASLGAMERGVAICAAGHGGRRGPEIPLSP